MSPGKRVESGRTGATRRRIRTSAVETVQLVGLPGVSKQDVACAALLQAALALRNYPLRKALQEQVLPLLSEDVMPIVLQQIEGWKHGENRGESEPGEDFEPADRNHEELRAELEAQASKVVSKVSDILERLGLSSSKILHLTIESVLPTLAYSPLGNEVPFEIAYLLQLQSNLIGDARKLRRRLSLEAPRPNETRRAAQSRLGRSAKQKIKKIIDEEWKKREVANRTHKERVSANPRGRRQDRKSRAPGYFFEIFLLSQLRSLTDKAFLEWVENNCDSELQDIRDALGVVAELTGISPRPRKIP